MPGRTRPSGVRRRRPSGTGSLAATQVIAAAMVVGSAWRFYGLGEAVGLLGMVLGIALYRVADDRRQDRLLIAAAGDLRAGDLARPAADLPRRSRTPDADVRAVLERGAGVVMAISGPRVVTAAEVGNLSVAQCLAGDWVRLSRPARSVVVDDRLADLRRLPRIGETWVVLVGDMPLGVLRRADVTDVVGRRSRAADPPSTVMLDPPRRTPWS